MRLSTGELFLIPAVLSVLGMVLTSRSAGRRNCDPFSLTLTVAVVGLIGSLFGLSLSKHSYQLFHLLQPTAVLITAFAGATGMLATVCYNAAMAIGPVGPISMIASMALLVSISLSILILGEQPAPTQVIGGIFLLASLALVNLQTPGKHRDGAFRWTLLAVLVMLLSGLTQFIMKYIHIVSPETPDLLFTSLTSTSGIVTMLACLAVLRRWPQARAIPDGVSFGICALVQTYCIVAALRTLPIATVFLTFTGGSLVLVILFSTLLLRERYPLPVWLGVALGLCGLFLTLLR